MHQPFVTTAGHPRAGQRIARQMCRIVQAVCVWAGGGGGGGYVISKNDIAIYNITYMYFRRKLLWFYQLAVPTMWGL